MTVIIVLGCLVVALAAIIWWILRQLSKSGPGF